MAARDSSSENRIETTEAKSAEIQPVFKVKFSMKVIAFCCAVVSLSWFFEGWREIHKTVNFINVAILVAGVVFTVLLLGLMSFWTYCEEKQKGTLIRRLALFESLYETVIKRQAAKTQGG